MCNMYCNKFLNKAHGAASDGNKEGKETKIINGTRQENNEEFVSEENDGGKETDRKNCLS
jgi:hypothetical protein